MFQLARPQPDAIHRFLERQKEAELTYAPLGISAQPPSGFDFDVQRVRIGCGRAAFVAAREAMHAWRMFDLGWVEIHPAAPPIRIGINVAVLARHFGVWSLNACRIVALLRESDDRFGFAYGTLNEHAESGEEAFVVEIDPNDESVWYEIRAASRPHAWLARLGYPVARRLQAGFRRDSAAAMQREVARCMGDRPLGSGVPRVR
jgi:uncharacterized protein (UPF0548 family)